MRDTGLVLQKLNWAAASVALAGTVTGAGVLAGGSVGPAFGVPTRRSRSD